MCEADYHFFAVDALAVTRLLAYQQRRDDILHARQYTLNSSV